MFPASIPFTDKVADPDVGGGRTSDPASEQLAVFVVAQLLYEYEQDTTVPHEIIGFQDELFPD